MFIVPFHVAFAVNGEVQSVSLDKKPAEEVGQWIESLRTRSGNQIVRLVNTWHTDSPSIQGIWTPFTNKDPKLNLVQFPSKELSDFQKKELSATERLLEIGRKLREQERLNAKADGEK
jgi:large subunit ribosomal protein L43